MISSMAAQRRVEVGDGDELRPAEQLRRGLGAGRPHEHSPLAEPGSQAAEAVGDAAVQVPDGGELLAARQDLVGLDRREGRRGRNEALRVLAQHALGPLQVQEVH
jgi:hypothetical protein